MASQTVLLSLSLHAVYTRYTFFSREKAKNRHLEKDDRLITAP